MQLPQVSQLDKSYGRRASGWIEWPFFDTRQLYHESEGSYEGCCLCMRTRILLPKT